MQTYNYVRKNYDSWDWNTGEQVEQRLYPHLNAVGNNWVRSTDSRYYTPDTGWQNVPKGYSAFDMYDGTYGKAQAAEAQRKAEQERQAEAQRQAAAKRAEEARIAQQKKADEEAAKKAAEEKADAERKERWGKSLNPDNYMESAKQSLDRIRTRSESLNEGSEAPKTESTFEVGKWKETVANRKPYEEMSTPGVEAYESGGYQNRTSDYTVPDRYQQPGQAFYSGKYDTSDTSGTNTIGGNIGENTGQSQPENLVPNPQDFGKNSIPTPPDYTKSRESFDAYQSQRSDQHRPSSTQTSTSRGEYDPQKLADPAHDIEKPKYAHDERRPFKFNYGDYVKDTDRQKSGLTGNQGFNFRDTLDALKQYNPDQYNRAEGYMKGKMGQMRGRKGQRGQGRQNFAPPDFGKYTGQKPPGFVDMPQIGRPNRPDGGYDPRKPPSFGGDYKSKIGDFMGKMKSNNSFNFNY